MIGKLIVWAPTRAEAVLRMRQALDEYVVEGIRTNLPFHRKLMRDARFMDGNFDTHFLEDFLAPRAQKN